MVFSYMFMIRMSSRDNGGPLGRIGPSGPIGPSCFSAVLSFAQFAMASSCTDLADLSQRCDVLEKTRPKMPLRNADGGRNFLLFVKQNTLIRQAWPLSDSAACR